VLKPSLSRQRYSFRLAVPDDDPALRRLLRETPMDGTVRLTLRREPRYFDSQRLEGEFCQTLVATDSTGDRLIALGSRSVRMRYVNGQPAAIGYLSGLRILPEHRGGTVLARGYRQLRRMHQDERTPYYLTTIADANRAALDALTGARAGMPEYRFLQRYQTFVLPLCRKAGEHPAGNVRIRALRESELPQLIDFLTTTGAEQQFFPRYQASDFFTSRGTFQGLEATDILTAWQGKRLVATLGLWDQSTFKQTVVEGYSQLLGAARLLYNAWARLRGWPRYPPVGGQLRSLVAAIPLAAPGYLPVLRQMIASAGALIRRPLPDGAGLLLGVSEGDPLLRMVSRASLFRYTTNIYLVYWNPESVIPDPGRNPNVYLELGCL
jgi:hypothetical protein